MGEAPIQLRVRKSVGCLVGAFTRRLHGRRVLS